VAKAAIAELRSVPRLVEILGSVDRIRRRVGIANVPGVEYTIVTDSIEENTAPVLVQFSIFAQNWNEMDEIEEILFSHLHHDGSVTIQGVPMFARYAGGRSIDDPAEGVMSRAVDYQFTLAREGVNNG
jgi:hypothetical protein